MSDRNTLLGIPKGTFPGESRLIYSASVSASGVTYGSTNANIVRLRNPILNIGADLELIDSSIEGSIIRVKNSGRYSITAIIRENGNFNTSVAVSRNFPGTDFSGSPWAHADNMASRPYMIAFGSGAADATNGTISVASYCGYFEAGDIVRMHSTSDNWDDGRIEVSRIS